MWVIYHKQCLDGTGAASALVKKFGDEVKQVPLGHSYKKSEIEEVLNARNDTIYVVDFSLQREDFEILLNNNNRIIHIDHHITAKEDVDYFQKYKNYEAVFDIRHSGAYLTWKYVHGFVPELIEIIEDRDLWIKKNPKTDVICYYLFSKVLDRPEELLSFMDIPVDELYQRGLEIKEYMEHSINQTLQKVEPVWIEYGFFFNKKRIPAINSHVYLSELGNELAKRFHGIACVFYISNHDVKLSFRSVEGTSIYARDAAKYFGGGGHLHAAGARIPLKKFIKLIKF